MDFKYGVRSAMTGRFKLSRIQDLNDAYEMRCNCVGELNSKVLHEFQKQLIKQYMDAPPVDEYGRRKLHIEDVLNESKSRAVETLNSILMERKTPESRQKILCFTDATVVDSNSDLLLWGHYGDKGKGVRILLDIPNDQENVYVIRRVRYTELRPLLNVSLFKSWMDLDVMLPFFVESVFTKGLGWAYEHELRLLAKNGAPEIISENGMDFIEFDVSSIKRIDFGPLTIAKDTDKIVEEIKSNEQLKHIQCRIACFGYAKYQYDYVDYDEVLKSRT